MRYPRFIQKGDTIAVTAPSEGNSEELDYIRLERAESKLMDKGFRIIETPDVRTCTNGRSASATVRAKEFEEVWTNPAVKAIVAAKGGDYLMEMLSYINFDLLKDNPVWFQGFSDNTSITFLLTTICDIASVYSNNFNDYAMENWHKSLINNIDILQGETVVQNAFDMYQDGFFSGVDGTESYNLTTSVEWKIITGEASIKDNICMKGRLLGGCLDVLLNLVGTRFDKVHEFVEKYSDDGIVWYMESFSLDGGSLERGLWQLGEAGWFEHVKGFIFGRPAFYNAEGYSDYQTAAMSQINKYGVPVIFDADIGHKPPQFTLINGAMCTVDCINKSIEMYFEE